MKDTTTIRVKITTYERFTRVVAAEHTEVDSFLNHLLEEHEYLKRMRQEEADASK